MEWMLISNNNIVTDAQQEEWRKDQKRQKILTSRISTERNSSKFSTYKHKPLPTTLKRHVIFLPQQLTGFFLHRTMVKEEDVDSLVKMLPRSLQPNNDVLCAELTLFRNHCRKNKLDI
ncbi:Hypothetical predicted protein [Paramuricea clavata]|uniref:Uncharacterized protein n=1 Tax=Paramuricea clavata TaxID=317549 RepID=A0A6S7HWM5_PARCT|nr:Hypothetical predicted protein [Paramuricea clavata]